MFSNVNLGYLKTLKEENIKLREEVENLRCRLAIAESKMIMYKCRKCMKIVSKVTIYKQQCEECDPNEYFYNEDLIQQKN